MIAFANVYGIEIRAATASRWATLSSLEHALPPTTGRLQTSGRSWPGKTITHDFLPFWGQDARPVGKRGPLTDKGSAPPSRRCRIRCSLVHPITGRKVLYANPGYRMRINELPVEERAIASSTLFGHELRPEYRYVHRWTEGDVLMWDNIGTMHNAIPDYRPDEPRLHQALPGDGVALLPGGTAEAGRRHEETTTN